MVNCGCALKKANQIDTHLHGYSKDRIDVWGTAAPIAFTTQHKRTLKGFGSMLSISNY